jgi:hypothetical protein
VDTCLGFAANAALLMFQWRDLKSERKNTELGNAKSLFLQAGAEGYQVPYLVCHPFAANASPARRLFLCEIACKSPSRGG